LFRGGKSKLFRAQAGTLFLSEERGGQSGGREKKTRAEMGGSPKKHFARGPHAVKKASPRKRSRDKGAGLLKEKSKKGTNSYQQKPYPKRRNPR